MSFIDAMRRNPQLIIISSIVLIALMLRLWGIWFGLPYLLHNDEGFEVIRALQLGNFQFDFDRIGKGGYFYLLFVEFGILFVVLKLIGIVGSPDDFARLFVSDPTLFYLVGRATTATIGALTVAFVYKIGRIAYSDRVAMFAACFLAVNALHVSLSHYITVDVPMVFLATVSLYFAIKLVDGGGPREYFLAALFAAFATATKVPAIVLVIPLFVAHVFRVQDAGTGWRDIIAAKVLWQSVLVFLITYLTLAPGIFVNYDVFLAEMFGKFSGLTESASGTSNDLNATLSNRDLFGFYIDRIQSSMGIPLFALSLAGIAYGLWARNRSDIILITFAAVMFLAVSLTSDSRHFFPRYILPILPVLALLAGRFLGRLLDLVKVGVRAEFQLALIVAFCVLPFIDAVANNALMVKPDTRVVAKEWIDANLPSGSRVLIEGARTRPFNGTVPLNNTRENLRESVAYYRENEPGKAKYFQLELQTLSGPTFDLYLVDQVAPGDYDRIRQDGVEFFVVRPAARAEIRQQKGWPAYIAALQEDPEIRLLKTFAPDADSRPGPLIQVYGKRSLPAQP